MQYIKDGRIKLDRSRFQGSATYLKEFHKAEGILSTPDGGDLFSTVDGRLSVRLNCDDGRELDLKLMSLSLVDDEELLLATDKGYWVCKILEE